MMTPNRFFMIKGPNGEMLVAYRRDVYDTILRLSELGVSISSSTLYRIKKGEFITRAGSNKLITIQCEK